MRRIRTNRERESSSRKLETIPNFVRRQNSAQPWKLANAPHAMGMCGRTRLSTDYSETRIKLKFDPDYPAPNVPASPPLQARDVFSMSLAKRKN
jgi:hypothetical protein